MIKRTKVASLGLNLALLLSVASGSSEAQAKKQTPKPAPAPVGPTPTLPPTADAEFPRRRVLDARDTTPPPRFEVKAPAGAPNVLIVLVDDMGFGMPTAFRRPVPQPAADAFANRGLRYNQFHTTALCSPTRTALLSGRNHHMNNMGGIT